MRPAIKHAIVDAFVSMPPSLQWAIAWRALRWRWQALRTRRPFAEIVLQDTLEFRMEQILLIHPESGLLLRHLAAGHVITQDADQISALLTAISDFTRDSFDVMGSTLDTIRVGELTVVVERGRYAALAGVLRGAVPTTVRGLLRDALEQIQRELGVELQQYDGDSAPFERGRPILERCLVTRFRAPFDREAPLLHILIDTDNRRSRA